MAAEQVAFRDEAGGEYTGRIVNPLLRHIPLPSSGPVPRGCSAESRISLGEASLRVVFLHHQTPKVGLHLMVLTRRSDNLSSIITMAWHNGAPHDPIDFRVEGVWLVKRVTRPRKLIALALTYLGCQVI